MSMRAFIRANAEALRAAIRKTCPNVGRLDEEQIRLWIMNDEELYLWAKREGVRL